MRTASWIGALWMAAMSLACRENAPAVSGVSEKGDVMRAITENLRTQLDSAGRFPAAVSEVPVAIAPAQAIVLAETFMRTIGRNLQGVVEAQHGASVDLNALVPDPQVLLAESPYLVPPDAPQPVRNAHSAYYLVQFRQPSGKLAMSVAVSTVADVVNVNGRLRFPLEFGNEFSVTGIPEGSNDGLPMFAEHAAVAAYELTGARVAQFPRLVLRGRGETRARGAPQHAMWRIRFDREVEVMDPLTNRRRRSSELYLGSDDQVAAASNSQPGALTVHYRHADGALSTTHLTRRSEYPVNFDQVVVWRPR